VTTRTILAALAVLGLACAALQPSSVLAQKPSSASDIPPNKSISIEYVPPKLTPTYERLKARRVLEQMSQFLSPLQLKRPLRLTTAQCGTVNAFYSPAARTVTMCYELVDHFNWELAAFVDGKLHYDPKNKRYTLFGGKDTIPLKPRLPPTTRAEAAVGAFFSVILHELGHAVFDIQEIPVLGREEDAADQIAALLMVQFGTEVARVTIKGAAASRDMRSQMEAQLNFPYYDEHSTSLQRLATFLCIAIGSREGAAFKDFVDAGLLPASRIENCPNEYREAADAFNATLMPAINKPLMEKVKAWKWSELFK
jgi:hypothetical protein